MKKFRIVYYYEDEPTRDEIACIPAVDEDEAVQKLRVFAPSAVIDDVHEEAA